MEERRHTRFGRFQEEVRSLILQVVVKSAFEVEKGGGIGEANW